MPDLYHPIDALPVLLPLWGGTVALSVAALARGRRLTPARVFTVVMAASYAAAVLALTLFPLRVDPGGATAAGGWAGHLNLLPVLSIDPFTFVLNVLMTVPLGMLAPLVFRVPTAASAALVGLGASLTIEGLQLLGNLVLGSGRVVDVNDLLANVAGTLVGWLLLQRLRQDPRCDRAAASLMLQSPVGRTSLGRRARDCVG